MARWSWVPALETVPNSLEIEERGKPEQPVEALMLPLVRLGELMRC